MSDDLPRLSQGLAPHNSFPLLSFASTSFDVAAIWVGLVIVFWSYWALSKKPYHER
jgi:hypothetical protein